MNIEKKLADWQKQKFLTAKEAEKILSYEQHKKANEFSYIMLGLGSFFIGVGLIALIAANWENISAGIKLGSAGLLLVLCACGIYICHLKGKTLLQEILLLLYALLILATIGLVAQIFQLQPEGLKAFVFWSLLCIPLLPLSSAQPLSWVWIPTFLISVCEQLGRQTWYQSWQNYISDNFAAGEGLFVLFLLTLIYAAIPQRLKGQAWYIIKNDYYREKRSDGSHGVQTPFREPVAGVNRQGGSPVHFRSGWRRARRPVAFIPPTEWPAVPAIWVATRKTFRPWDEGLFLFYGESRV